MVESLELRLLSMARMGISAANSMQKAYLDEAWSICVTCGWKMFRPSFPGADTPPPIYRLTSDGIDLLEAIEP